jgi:ATP-binding protein involved in chromosome partitioning
LNTEAVRASLHQIPLPDGDQTLDVRDILVEGDWIGVSLRTDEETGPDPRVVYDGLAAAFPAATIEVRTGGQVYRGGNGLGSGKHLIAVLGGKGGVGKSTVAINLALTLAAMGLRVGAIDGDINGPDLPHLVGVHPTADREGQGWLLWNRRLVPPSRRLSPFERYGIELVSVGFAFPEHAAPVVGGRAIVSALLRHLVFDVRWHADVLVIDAPPGTGDEIQAMIGELPLDGVLLVTTPQDLAQLDAGRTQTLLQQRGVPVIGLVQNMSSLTCPHCDRPIDLFAPSRRLVHQDRTGDIPLLASIPFDVRLAEAADQGLPLVLADPTGPLAATFGLIGARVRAWLINRDDSDPTLMERSA